MSKETISVKSNGLRNELKEIRKSIDNLTNAILMAQTNKQYENDNFKPYWEYNPDRVRWYTTGTSTADIRNDEEV